eukprot:SAG22_NODE_19081_length_278_cov_0.849162_1_plen_58_part_10
MSAEKAGAIVPQTAGQIHARLSGVSQDSVFVVTSEFASMRSALTQHRPARVMEARRAS